jgi:glycosyltransferase involved in cell wall biosynthesis
MAANCVAKGMRIVVFTFGSNLYGGNLSMVDLLQGLKSHGVESLVFSPETGPLFPRLTDLQTEHALKRFKDCVHWQSDKPRWHPRRWVSATANSLRSLNKRSFNLFRMAEVAEACRKFGADAVLTNTCAINVGLAVAKRIRRPHIWHFREFGDLDWDFFPDFGFRARRFQMQDSHRVLFISRAVKTHHLKQCGLQDSERFRVFYDGIATQNDLSERAAENLQPLERPYIFGIAGLIKPSKGQFDAVSALSALTNKGLNVHLRVAGGGGVEELRKHSEQLRVADKVEILGHLAGAQMDDFYKGIDCGLMCSVAEGFGRTTVEYMSWGKPVIGRNSGATPELVFDRENGLLYDHSVDALARAMETTVADPVRCRAMGLAAAKFAANFSNERVASDFLAALS